MVESSLRASLAPAEEAQKADDEPNMRSRRVAWTGDTRAAGSANFDTLPSHASRAESARGERAAGTVQFHITGPGGGDWYAVAGEEGIARREGRAENPEATVSVAAE